MSSRRKNPRKMKHNALVRSANVRAKREGFKQKFRTLNGKIWETK